MFSPPHIATSFTLARRWGQPDRGERIQQCSVHTVEHYSALKGKETQTPTPTWKKPEDVTLSEEPVTKGQRLCGSLYLSYKSCEVTKIEEKVQQ